MIGYKILDKDMRAINGNYMQYELNKVFIHNGILRLQHHGFHYCKELRDCFAYYRLKGNRVFKIDTLDGNIKSDIGGILYVTDKIILIEELSIEEVNKYIEDNLDRLVKDGDIRVRGAVARHGYFI